MRNTTAYTFFFAFIICIVCAMALGSAVSLLRDKQQENVEVDKKKNILMAMGFEGVQKKNNKQVKDTYAQFVKEIKTGKNLEVYLRTNKKGEVEKYAIPISGKGLWSTIYGYLALEKDLNTVAGITFYKHGETPGLGGEVEKEWFTSNFKGKKILGADGNLKSVEVVKGTAPPDAPHKVDGISGATFTIIGVTRFLKNDLEKYEKYFAKERAKLSQADASGADQSAPEGEQVPPANTPPGGNTQGAPNT